MAILNPAPATETSPALIGRAQWLVPNEVEAGTLCGFVVNDVRTAQEAAAKLLDVGVPRVIITLGEQGCLLADGHDLCHLPAPVVAAIDTTAAGDAFIGALAVGLLKGMHAAAAACFANCAGALATTRMGAQTSLPYAGEVEALYVQHRQQAR